MAKGKACNGNVQSEEPLICERTDMHELSGGSDTGKGSHRLWLVVPIQSLVCGMGVATKTGA